MKGLSQRIITAVIFVGVIILGVFGGQITFAALCLLITALCSYELLNLLLPDLDQSITRKVFGVLLTLAPVLYVYSFEASWVIVRLPIFALLSVSCCCVLLFELFSRSLFPFQAVGTVLTSILYIGVPLALIVHLSYETKPYDAWFMFSIFIFTWINDTGAYFSGSLFGKTPLFKRISPNKTIEGSIGGFVFTIIGGYILSMISPKLTEIQWMILAGIVAIFASLGDLIESMLKRS